MTCGCMENRKEKKTVVILNYKKSPQGGGPWVVEGWDKDDTCSSGARGARGPYAILSPLCMSDSFQNKTVK